MSELCYLCGKAGADTTEHVVPRTFYVPPLPSDVITLPAHEVCNRSTSKDEEWLAIGLGTSRPSPDDGDPRYEKSKRALLRDEAEGLRRKFLDSMTPHPSGGAILDLGNGRVEHVLAKIAKGLVFKRDGLLLSQEHTWRILSIDIATMVEQPYERFHQAHDVATFRWQPLGATVFWTLGLYNMHLFWGAAIAPEDRDRLGAKSAHLAKGARLPWPKPTDFALAPGAS